MSGQIFQYKLKDEDDIPDKKKTRKKTPRIKTTPSGGLDQFGGTISRVYRGIKIDDDELVPLKQKVYDFYKDSDGRQCWDFIVTSKFEDNDNILPYISDILGNSLDLCFEYVFFPALQENGRLHYHGIARHKQNMILEKAGIVTTGSYEVKLCNGVLQQKVGKPQIKNFQQDDESDGVYDFKDHLLKWLDYVFTEDNFLSVNQYYKIETNIYWPQA